jgi:hypothetical protein
MPLAKLTCPKCHATLKPAKPVPEGKTVKCPKCEEMFKAGEKSSEDASEKPAKKAAAAKSEEPEEPEEAATYAVLKDEDEEKKKAEAEERKRRKKKRMRDDDDGEDDDEDDEDDVTKQYLENLKPRDPRGAAQETVVGPANWILRTALLAFFGWVGYFVAFMLPVAFPNIEKKEEGDQFHPPAAAQEKDQKKPSEKKQAIHWWSADTILDEDNRPWSILLFIFVLLVGLSQAAVLANASVKMQGLESYNWALWGCIITLIPLATFPWFVFITYIFDLLDWLIEMDLGEMCWMIGLIAFVWCPLVGGICLKKILEPQVRPGFEYKPE